MFFFLGSSWPSHHSQRLTFANASTMTALTIRATTRAMTSRTSTDVRRAYAWSSSSPGTCGGHSCTKNQQRHNPMKLLGAKYNNSDIARRSPRSSLSRQRLACHAAGRRRHDRRPENVPGDVYVDDTCINCDTCRWMSPGVFAEVRSCFFFWCFFSRTNRYDWTLCFIDDVFVFFLRRRRRLAGRRRW